ncbi:MAG: hypothetical protein FRX48_01447 [Lasallia pustulata]|uniref:Uncharacterized protein n=1 Tax=Lasallia pustulata TaxID=136370 RepID=A0A5M8PZ10_9LECA|nr:MAG: hypothetical protein FRX48_01447 [Lasallia pustulata]
MSSDDTYASFLDQANQDAGAGAGAGAGATTWSKSREVATKAVDTEVPLGLSEVEVYYTSDADEPFEPVSLKWGGGGCRRRMSFRL